MDRDQKSHFVPKICITGRILFTIELPVGVHTKMWKPNLYFNLLQHYIENMRNFSGKYSDHKIPDRKYFGSLRNLNAKKNQIHCKKFL